MLYARIMPARPVQISIDSALLERVDADPETQTRGRSAFVRSAIERYLALKSRQQIDRQIAGAYQGNADALLDDVTGLMDIQQWPDE
jgi:metal-responsive CopG/Arc/MetJ family transcriptional regulator